MKAPAPSDPMALVGVALPDGDIERMAECLVEEYLLLGWSEPQLMLFFTRPCFRATHRIYQQKGEAYVRALIDRAGAEWRDAGAQGVEGDA